MTHLAKIDGIYGGPIGIVLLIIAVAFTVYVLFFGGPRLLRGESRRIDITASYRWLRSVVARSPGQDDLDAVAHVPSGLLRWRPLLGRRNTDVEDSILQAQHDCGCPLCLQVIAESVQSASSTS